MTVLSDRLKQLRIDSGKGQKEVTTDLKLKQAALSNYENGVREPSVEILNKFAKYYEVTVDYLTGNSEFKSPQYEAIVNQVNIEIDIANTLKDLPEQTRDLFYQTLKSGTLIDLIDAIQFYKEWTPPYPTEHIDTLKQFNILPVVLVYFNKLLDEVDPGNKEVRDGEDLSKAFPRLSKAVSEGVYNYGIKEFEKRRNNVVKNIENKEVNDNGEKIR